MQQVVAGKSPCNSPEMAEQGGSRSSPEREARERERGARTAAVANKSSFGVCFVFAEVT